MRHYERKYISKQMRQRVEQKYNGKCAYCGETPNRIVIDHLIPHSYNQDDSFENLMPSCKACNNYKMTWFIEEFRKEIERSIEKLRKYSVNYRFAEKYGLVESNIQRVKFYFENYNNSGECNDS